MDILIEYFLVLFLLVYDISCEVIWFVFAFAYLEFTVFLLKFFKSVFVPFQLEILLFLTFCFWVDVG